MKIIKEHINEKFIEDSDPIQDLGIGIFTYHNFDSVEEFMNFLMKAIPIILGKQKIPRNILSGGGAIKMEYYWAIKQYLDKYNISVKNIQVNDISKGSDAFFWPIMIRDRLQPLNKLKKYINEKFEQDSDPIKDLKIGYYDLEEICKNILNLDKNKKRFLISIYAYKNKKGMIFNVKNLQYKFEYTQYFIELLKELNYFYLFKMPIIRKYNIEWLFKEKYKNFISVDMHPYYSAEVYYSD